MAIEIIFGWLASFLCTFIMVPQIIKAFKTRHTDDVSMLMLVISVLGNFFWVAHALMTKNVPLVIGAGLIGVMSFVLIMAKYAFDSK